jgi:hypothetical protein
MYVARPRDSVGGVSRNMDALHDKSKFLRSMQAYTQIKRGFLMCVIWQVAKHSVTIVTW